MRWRDIRFGQPTEKDGAIFCKDTSGGCEYLCSWYEVGHDSIWMPISELPQPDLPGPIPDGWRAVNKALDAFRDDAKCWAGMSYGWSQTLNAHIKEYSTDRDYIVPIDPPEPQYRAFANAAEFMPHADRWITRSFSICPDRAGAFRCSAFDDYGIWEQDKRTSYSELTREGRKFADDGTPFGVLIETNQ